MKTIAIYDVTGIQEFIFASNKVKENVGASIIVQKVFEEYLNEAIKKSCSKYRTKWEEYSDFQICSDSKLQAEVIFMGGGNATIVYQNRETAVGATKKLSHEILKKTGGTLKFAVAYLDTECKNYLNDRDELINELKINKYRMIHQAPLLGIGITRKGNTDGLPATKAGDDKNEYISKSARIKRDIFKYNKYFDHMLPNTVDYDFPLEFDDLGQKKGENYIAVVHIDGNNMGQKLGSLLKFDRSAEYQKSIQIIRSFSKEVDVKYRSAMRRVVLKLADGLKTDAFYKRLDPVVKNQKLILPIRPIVRSGDDVTFVCNGKIGIALAEAFLMQLYKDPGIHINGSVIEFSACAGVAIVKSHFPFYRAYHLAKELCKSAKMKGKILAKQNGVEDIANWLDFHIVQTGITTNLKEIRDRFYQVPGMEGPDGLIYEEYGDVQMKLGRYNLLWRPWCIAGNCDEKYEWDRFRDIYTAFTKKKKDEVLWKRSRLKKLESEMSKSESDVQAYVRECKSRGFRLPECSGNSHLYRDEQTPYFDALELLDFYVQLPEAEEVSHEN